MQYAIFMWMNDKHRWVFYALVNSQEELDRRCKILSRQHMIYHTYELPLVDSLLA